MKDAENEEIKEVYARYGLAMYEAQCVEKALAILLASRYEPQNIHRYAYDERLNGNLNLTYGRLVEKFVALATEESELGETLRQTVEPRNWLAHRYFWDRVVEFQNHEGRIKMITELQELVDLFEKMDDRISQLTEDWMKEKGVSEEDIFAFTEKMVVTGETPEDRPAHLEKSVIIVSAHEWVRPNDKGAKSALLLRTGDGRYLLLSNNGLCLGPHDAEEGQLWPLQVFEKALPARVKTKPKRARDWNYQIPLSNGFELWVRPGPLGREFVCRYGLRKQRPNT